MWMTLFYVVAGNFDQPYLFMHQKSYTIYEALHCLTRKIISLIY